MKIIRICAANIREAMRRVRDELGPDAVILSNRRVDRGVEIIASTDYDEALLQQIPPTDSDPIAEPSAAPQQPTAQSAAGPGKLQVVWSQDPLLLEMQNEIKVLRNLLEQQVSGPAWGEQGRRQPYRIDLLSQLTDLGLKQDLCLRLAEGVADEPDLKRARELALTSLANGIATSHDDILTQGGLVALVGPTGVGKTTTVAKLAARYTLRHGPGQVALITTDSYRIGGFEQLHTFGVIMDMPVRLADNHQELQEALAEFSDKSLILIDTAGMSQRDLRLSRQFAVLGGVPQIKNYLVLAANAQADVLEEVVSAFGRVPLAGCILTKLDETSQLGGALAVIYERELPLAYVTDGQRVPEDLQAAQMETLVRFASDLAELRSDSSGEDEMLALTFGRRVANGCL